MRSEPRTQRTGVSECGVVAVARAPEALTSLADSLRARFGFAGRAQAGQVANQLASSSTPDLFTSAVASAPTVNPPWLLVVALGA